MRIYSLIITFSFVIPTFSHTISWPELLAAKAELIADTHLLRQYEAYSASQSPTISDPRIKAIDIIENNDPIIDIHAMLNHRIGMLPTPEKPFSSPDYNSGLPSASKMRARLYAKLERMIEYLDLLAPEFGYEPGQVSIKIFEALRDTATQNMLFQIKVSEIKKTHPNLTEEQLEQEAAKWVSPTKNNVPVHSTGAAVDIRLWDNKNQTFIDTGTFGAVRVKNDIAPTFSEGCSDAQKHNRLYCLLAATYAGLTNYSYEWWHFSAGDRYDAYWNNY